MKPPKILVETKVVEEGVVWKIKKALYVHCLGSLVKLGVVFPGLSNIYGVFEMYKY